MGKVCKNSEGVTPGDNPLYMMSDTRSDPETNMYESIGHAVGPEDEERVYYNPLYGDQVQDYEVPISSPREGNNVLAQTMAEDFNVYDEPNPSPRVNAALLLPLDYEVPSAGHT